MDARAAPRFVRRTGRDAARRLRTEVEWLGSRRVSADIAVFHDFEPPPAGGGHQFLRALVGELEGRGLAVEHNRISGGTRGVPLQLVQLRLRTTPALRARRLQDGAPGRRPDRHVPRFRRRDGSRGLPVDQRRACGHDGAAVALQPREARRARASSCAIRSSSRTRSIRRSSIRRTRPEDRSTDGHCASSRRAGRRIPERVLDIVRVARSESRPGAIRVTFSGSRHSGSSGSGTSARSTRHGVARLLREHDVYLAASSDDPCSNALLEALASGLPAAYLDSGGHPELVGDGGLPYREPEDLPDVFARLSAGLDAFRAAIRVPSIADVADAYMSVLGVGDERRP